MKTFWNIKPQRRKTKSCPEELFVRQENLLWIIHLICNCNLLSFGFFVHTDCFWLYLIRYWPHYRKDTLEGREARRPRVPRRDGGQPWRFRHTGGVPCPGPCTFDICAFWLSTSLSPVSLVRLSGPRSDRRSWSRRIIVIIGSGGIVFSVSNISREFVG